MLWGGKVVVLISMMVYGQAPTVYSSHLYIQSNVPHVKSAMNSIGYSGIIEFTVYICILVIVDDSQ